MEATASSLLLPWHNQQWQAITTGIKLDRMPHGLICHGTPGAGQFEFAMGLSQRLLCQSPASDDMPCGQCPQCFMVRNKQHPSIRLIEPEEENKGIKVDQVRDIHHFIMTTTSSQYPYKIVIINPADGLNITASNSLLKLLEEPASDSCIILCTSQLHHLLPTIRSRCQKLAFIPQWDQSIAQWLGARLSPQVDPHLMFQLALGGPLLALHIASSEVLSARDQWFDDVLKYFNRGCSLTWLSKQWLNLEFPTLLVWLTTCLNDILKLRVHDEPINLIHSDKLEILQNLREKLELKQIYDVLDLLCTMKRQWLAKINLNRELLVERILIEFEKGKCINDR